jgi:dTDP-4-dehydrorhamnose 3,5-epimerase-like enzyme
MEEQVNKLNIFSDFRGDLIPIDFIDLPFTPKRVFTVNNVPKNSIRGNHSHFETVQILICVSGIIEVILHDGFLEKSTVLQKGESIIVNNLIWDSQKFLSQDSTLLVICSTEYDKNDYIDDFYKFLKIKSEKKIKE